MLISQMLLWGINKEARKLVQEAITSSAPSCYYSAICSISTAITLLLLLVPSITRLFAVPLLVPSIARLFALLLLDLLGSDHNVLRSLGETCSSSILPTLPLQNRPADHLKEPITRLHSDQSPSTKDKRLRVT